MGLIAQG